MVLVHFKPLNLKVAGIIQVLSLSIKKHTCIEVFIYNNGIIELGENFRLGDSKLFCEKKIEFGNDCMISWDCIICDSDLHNIKKDNIRINNDKEIIIGNHVWICSYCHIFKGTTICSNAIIGSDSHLSNTSLSDEKCIYGSKGIIIKKNIEWDWELN